MEDAYKILKKILRVLYLMTFCGVVLYTTHPQARGSLCASLLFSLLSSSKNRYLIVLYGDFKEG